jgi:hypothetical protein
MKIRIAVLITGALLEGASGTASSIAAPRSGPRANRSGGQFQRCVRNTSEALDTRPQGVAKISEIGDDVAHKRLASIVWSLSTGECEAKLGRFPVLS